MRLLPIALALLSLFGVACRRPGIPASAADSKMATTGTRLIFTVTASPGKLAAKTTGRLMVVVAPDAKQNDLRDRLDDVEAARSGAAFGTDATFGKKGGTTTVDMASRSVRSFPLTMPGALTPGTYRVQAVFTSNPDLRDADAPGNMYSEPETMTLPRDDGLPVSLLLSEQEPDDPLPADSDNARFLKLRSEKLSRFYKRPIYVYAGVVLPTDYEDAPSSPYPMCVRGGGFHTRYTAAKNITPYAGIVQVTLDGDGPFGDSYSTNSAVGGPYGDATVNELLPEIEKRFHCGGSALKRFTTGGSTGGWVSLALQIYYPDTFGGCWSGYPDPLDFHAYQAGDLLLDANAYATDAGTEQVSSRDVLTGTAKWTVREECALENVRGMGGSYVTSGGQWGVWNSVWGKPDRSGRAVPFWDPVSGKINRGAVNTAAKQYDLRRYCADNWKTLAPKLDGKIHLWVGERDDYFLNAGVHKFDDFLQNATPKITARVEYSPLAGHGWEPRSRAAVLDEMLAASRGSSQP